MSYQQPPPPDQQQWQPPYPYQSPPQPTKRKPRLPRWLWIVIIVFVAGSVIAGVIQGVSQAVQPTPPTTTVQVTSAPNMQATDQAESTTLAQAVSTNSPSPTTAPSGIPVATHGTPRLGGSLSDFIGAYGQPDTIAQGDYDFQNHTLTAMTEGNAVNAVLDAPPGNTDTWNAAEAKDACLAFAPPDATYKQHISHSDSTGPTNEAYVYVSPSLATHFPANDFTDENGNATTPGTFTIEIDYNTNGSTTEFIQCSIETAVPSQ